MISRNFCEKSGEFQLRKLDDQIASIKGQLEEKQQQELEDSKPQSTDQSDSSSDSMYGKQNNSKDCNQDKGAKHNSIVTPTKKAVD